MFTLVRALYPLVPKFLVRLQIIRNQRLGPHRRIVNFSIYLVFVANLFISLDVFAFLHSPNWEEPVEKSFWTQMSKHFTIDWDENNPYVQKQIRWYQQHPKHLRQVLKNSEPFIHYVYAQTHRKNLPAELALIPLIESQYNPKATGFGTAGLWQMMPGTALKFGLKINHAYDGRKDVTASTTAALNYLSYLYHYFNQDWLLALAAYQVGEGKIKNLVNRKETNFWQLPLSRQTKEYVPKLLAIASIIRQPHAYHISLPSVEQAPAEESTWQEASTLHVAENEAIVLDEPASTQDNPPPKIKEAHKITNYTIKQHDSLATIARHFHVSIDSIKKSNHLKTTKLKIGRALIIPSTTPISDKKAKTKQGQKKYIIRSKDNLSSIAKKFHLSVNQLQKVNHLKDAKKLRVGQVLIISKTQAGL